MKHNLKIFIFTFCLTSLGFLILRVQLVEFLRAWLIVTGLSILFIGLLALYLHVANKIL